MVLGGLIARAAAVRLPVCQWNSTGGSTGGDDASALAATRYDINFISFLALRSSYHLKDAKIYCS